MIFCSKKMLVISATFISKPRESLCSCFKHVYHVTKNIGLDEIKGEYSISMHHIKPTDFCLHGGKAEWM